MIQEAEARTTNFSVFLLVAVVLDESGGLRRGKAVDLILGDSNDVCFVAEEGVNGGPGLGGLQSFVAACSAMGRRSEITRSREKEVVAVDGRNRRGRMVDV